MKIPSSEFNVLYIFGAGGSGRETAWLASEAWGDKLKIYFLVDSEKYVTRGHINQIPVGLIESAVVSEDSRYLVALGDPRSRRSASEKMEKLGHKATVLLHPKLAASPWVEFSEGVVVCAGTILTTNIKVGRHVQINIGCTISHDVSIGEFSTLSPGVKVSGNVIIGSDVFIGTGVSIINGSPDAPLVIGDGAVLAAGACIIKSVSPYVMVAGVPATTKRSFS